MVLATVGRVGGSAVRHAVADTFYTFSIDFSRLRAISGTRQVKLVRFSFQLAVLREPTGIVLPVLYR